MTLDLFAPKKHAPTLHHGDCLAVLKTLPDASVDGVVTDPPYLIDFMGKSWDSADGIAGKPDVWAECLRVLKPGGHLLAFGATRTYHRMTCAIEDAGFEIRDSIHWMYGSGFPKSLDVSKAMDNAAGAEREVVGQRKLTGTARKSTTHTGHGAGSVNGADPRNYIETFQQITAPATDLAKQWQGWGTALKPSHEPVVVARKPLAGTVAANVERYGTGALNIDASRVAATQGDEPLRWAHGRSMGFHGAKDNGPCEALTSAGRWPPNIVLSHTEDCAESACDETCAVAELDRQSDSSSRFFPVFRYQAKASRSEREAGLREAGLREAGLREAEVRTGMGGKMPVDDNGKARDRFSKVAANTHPTVKPIALMEWLVTLVTPPGGVVLDPFMGSGTTGVAAARKGFRFVGIEREDEYLAIARARIEAA